MEPTVHSRAVKAGEVGGWRRTGRTLVRAGDVPITLDLTKIVHSTHSALRTVLQGEDLIENRPDVCSGEPVFKGTRLPVVHLVEQFRTGVPFSEMAEDYPPSSARKPCAMPSYARAWARRRADRRGH